VRDQQQGQALQQLLLSVQQLTQAIGQLQLVVRSEQEHTRRALLMHFGAEGLDKPTEKADLELERGGLG
jgi:hypothetical protein